MTEEREDSTDAADLSQSLEALEAPSMRIGALLRSFGPGLIFGADLDVVDFLGWREKERLAIVEDEVLDPAEIKVQNHVQKALSCC